MKIDLHCHTKYSGDNYLEPEELINKIPPSFTPKCGGFGFIKKEKDPDKKKDNKPIINK
jgi:hypothetical protein